MKSASIGVAIVALAMVFGATACGSKSSTPASSSSSAKPSSSSASSSTTATSSAAAPSGTASGPNPTIDDYIKSNNIEETIVHHGDPGAPTIDLPVPQNWTKLPEQNAAPYGAIAFQGATNPQDPPTIRAILAKLTGNVDPEQILNNAPGELKNLPGYSGGDGQRDSLSGFPAYQLGGTYTKDGAQRTIAQKTVVIQSPNGMYVLQLNAEGPQSDSDALMSTTNVIDEQTTITP